ncbi:unnamed protein product [Phytophthora fragariaefolia]|uniref:Unnamed protein product n=1 Tax=Phytophthora fragariaefolia TaxID=1490495 RepID=A0A9W6TQW9_9STRA|nr:unnamed protein product [Phytophthora fragariaefolia]
MYNTYDYDRSDKHAEECSKSSGDPELAAEMGTDTDELIETRNDINVTLDHAAACEYAEVGAARSDAMKPHPTLKRFVRVIKNIAGEFVMHCRSIISGNECAPVRPNLRFPRAATLPSIDDIDDSDSEDCNDAGNSGSGDDADSQTSDGDLGTPFDYDGEEKTDESVRI